MERLSDTPELTRRNFGLVISSFVVAGFPLHAQEGRTLEEQIGDPTAPREGLSFNPSKVEKMVLGGSRASYAARDMAFGPNLLASSASFLGKSRAQTPERIADFLALFDLPFREGNAFVPFCAAGLSFAAAHSYAKFLGRTITPATEIGILRDMLGEIERYHFYPSPSVWDMYYVARGKRRWADRTDAPLPKPGWLVIYDWNKNGGANHVAVVESANASTLNTIEFNTASQTSDGSQSNGGIVTRRNRPLDSTVKGYIMTDRASPFDRDT